MGDVVWRGVACQIRRDWFYIRSAKDDRQRRRSGKYRPAVCGLKQIVFSEPVEPQF